MSAFTNSLNSQLRMLSIDGQLENPNESLNLGQLSLSNLPDGEAPSNDKLPNDLNLLKSMLEMRIRYTRPRHGGEWEFSNIPNDIRYIQEIIRFIDANCAQDANIHNTQNLVSNSYKKYLQPLEILPEELDSEFGIRFYPYLSFKSVRGQLIKQIKASQYEFLSGLLEFPRDERKSIHTSWIIYPKNSKLSIEDYNVYYNRMDDNLKEWLMNYCITDKSTYGLCQEPQLTSFDVLFRIVSMQNQSYQIKSLIEMIVTNSGSEGYLKDDNFLTYLTYVDHLQSAIETSFPKCLNPYKCAMNLMFILKGMSKYPELMQQFQVVIHQFLNEYPNFTLGDLTKFLQDRNMPNIGGLLKISS